MAHFGSIWSLLAKEVCKYLVKVFQAMASTKFYLDHRNVADGCECPLKIAIFTAQNTSFINLGFKLLPKQWDKANFRVVNHPQKDALNLLLNQRKQEIDMLIFEHSRIGRTEHTAKEIKDIPLLLVLLVTFVCFLLPNILLRMPILNIQSNQTFWVNNFLI